MLQIVNIDRTGYVLPGGISHPDDRAIVYDTERTEPNTLTGKPQTLAVYRGTLSGAHAFVRAQDAARTIAERARDGKHDAEDVLGVEGL